jgi:hypothetical protein
LNGPVARIGNDARANCTTNEIGIHPLMGQMAISDGIGNRNVLILCSAALTAIAGCGGVKAYRVDPVAASKAAMEQYDKDGDGLLDQTELKACPALLREIRAYDSSKDKKLSADEIGAVIKDMYDQGAGMTFLSCSVSLDGSPLSGATVRFIPEAFLGAEIKEAKGVTNAAGTAALGLPPEELPKQLRRHNLMRVGIYRVEITHPSKKIPAKYNTDTELGFEFHQTNHVQPPTFNLVSK